VTVKEISETAKLHWNYHWNRLDKKM